LDCGWGGEWTIHRKWLFFWLLADLKSACGDFVGAITFCAALRLFGGWWHEDDCALLNTVLMHEGVEQVVQTFCLLLVTIAAEALLRDDSLKQ